MLEQHANQAAGLLGLGSQRGPRMLAVVSHGDEQAELPLLWQLCLALVSFGYAVTVLDATIEETDSNPGLAELLDSERWKDVTSRDAPAWTVLPAGKGIQSLCAMRSPVLQSLQQLGHLFPQDGVVVLYSKVEWMTPLISHTGIEPLLAVSHSRTSLITSYLALKRLLITGKLKPTIVNLTQASMPTPPDMAHKTLTSLSDCAKKFLGQDVKAINIIEQMSEDGQNDDIQRLALRLMENALPLATMYMPIVASAHTPHFGQIDRFAGSH
jgi:hypothetical protein